MDLSHTPIDIEEWKGIFARGLNDTAPPGYFLDTLNTKFTESDIVTRDGSVLTFDTSGVIIPVDRFFIYKKLTNSRFLYHRFDALGGGSVEDSLVGVGLDIFPANSATAIDFSMINFNGRAYLSQHNRIVGTTVKNLHVYDPDVIGALARPAAGTAPTTTLTPANSATAGNCEAGVHIITYAFLTDSGFITAPATGNTVTSTGGKKIDLTSVDVGPAGTVSRIIIATKAIQNYNGNLLGYPFFIVNSANGGLIADNVTTTGALSFFDSELIESADYLFDNRATIPSPIGMCEYKGRMVIWGISGDEHSVYLSKPYAPEQFDSVAGFITVDPFESTSGVRNCFVFRGSLIICKQHRMYQSTDNGGDPATWPLDIIDHGTGTECFGSATIIDSRGQQNDRTFIADRSGLVIFEGYVRRPEGSWLVEDTWKRINKAKFSLIQVCVDPITSSLYVSLPLDGSTTINYILYGYYGDAFNQFGFDPKEIRYSLWQFAAGTASILVDVDDTTSESVFRYVGATNNIHSVKQDNLVHSDVGIPFSSFVKTALYQAKDGWIDHFAGVRIRVLGNGILNTQLAGEDDVKTQNLANITMSITPGGEPFLLANFQNEKCSIKFTTGVSLNEYFKIGKVQLFAKPLWFTRPM